MNISYKWLKRYINLQDDAETVAKILTSIGLEVGTVETVETIKGGLKGLVVGLRRTERGCRTESHRRYHRNRAL